MNQDTPCIAICKIDPGSRLCLGCGRTLAEIVDWSRMDSAARRTLMALLPARMAKAGLRRVAAHPARD